MKVEKVTYHFDIFAGIPLVHGSDPAEVSRFEEYMREHGAEAAPADRERWSQGGCSRNTQNRRGGT